LKNPFAQWFKRANPENPATPLSDPDSWLWSALGARTSATGVAVTPETSLQTTSVWAAVRLISSTLATLPLPVYKRIDSGKEKALEHPLYRLLHDRPNPEQSSFIWREQMLAHLLLYGNYYAEIERNGRGEPVGLWPLLPTQVRIQRVGDKKLYLVRVLTTTGLTEEVTLSPENVLHIPGFSLDGCLGLIPVSLATNAIGLASATESFGSSFFGNGASPSGVLSHPGKLGKQAADNLRTSWAALYSGLTNAQRIAILEEGMQWNPLGVPPEHAQFLETRRFQVSEIARVFGIPPHLIGDLDRATFSNIEAQGIEFVTYCLAPWAKRIEQELNYRLFADSSLFAEFVLDGLLRGDSAARAAYYTAMANIGVLSINEIREKENLNRIDGGDAHLVPLNMAPLSNNKTTPNE
jgi:HK97 family phage portal protein